MPAEWSRTAEQKDGRKKGEEKKKDKRAGKDQGELM